ncbi:MAG: Unknown protein [uncultured Sulfurovum sp.]|uniref:Uncharacterized protein n=1 Tax=uncultured Sulfurovum sp. TaxID=269237 RepID=A0A6S6THC1_9BACT|nr:MAG: Unknown protein [uncultured Sulfurovum sp.]
MLNHRFLRLGTISALLTSTLLGAGTSKCIGGVCFVNLDNLDPSKGFQKEKLVVIEKPRYIEEMIDKSMTIVLDGELITVFPHSSYVADDVEEQLLVVDSTDTLEETILTKTGLPSSEFFCDKNTKPLYDTQHNTFQCV